MVGPCTVSLGNTDRWTDQDRTAVLAAVSDACSRAAAEWRKSGQQARGEVDPLALVEAANCTVKVGRINEGVDPEEKGWVSGALSRAEGETVTRIALESLDSLERRRFTLTHEYAHMLLARSNDQNPVGCHALAEVRRPNDRDDDDAVYCRQSPEEYAADLFTHMFLMPSAIVRRLRDAGTSPDHMARYFRVTARTMRRRILYLDLEPSALSIA